EGGFAVNPVEETIDATLDANGQLRLAHQPSLPPGPVRVTIRVATPVGPRRGMADVVQEVDAGQRLRGFQGRTAEELKAEEEAREAEDDERNREQDAARRAIIPCLLIALSTLAMLFGESRARASEVTLQGSVVCNGACVPDPKKDDHVLA